jgi:hypothetical protein
MQPVFGNICLYKKYTNKHEETTGKAEPNLCLVKTACGNSYLYKKETKKHEKTTMSAIKN